MLTIIWILIAVVALIILMLIGYYNKFVILGQRANNSLAQIDVQLKKRADLVPNLIETVKGYAKHEKGIMDSVSQARAAMISAKDIVSKMKAGNVLNNALGKLFAIAENYPQLKANENFLQLQQELASIEDKIAYARQYYNDSIMSYNTACKTFPGSFFAGIFGKKEMEYLQIPEAQKAVPKVSF
jgi:LemA protein